MMDMHDETHAAHEQALVVCCNADGDRAELSHEARRAARRVPSAHGRPTSPADPGWRFVVSAVATLVGLAATAFFAGVAAAGGPLWAIVSGIVSGVLTLGIFLAFVIR